MIIVELRLEDTAVVRGTSALLVADVLAAAFAMRVEVDLAAVGGPSEVRLDPLGRYVERCHAHHWFPVSPHCLEQAQDWYRRCGKWSFLASWVPIVGDPITVVAGILREPLATFVVVVSIAKVGRYAVLALTTTGLT